MEREGKVMGDHAGHIVYDDAAGGFLIGVSTWGDFTYEGVEIYYTRELSGDDPKVLHGVHVLEKAQELNLPTALPTEPTGNWDPHFVRIGQRLVRGLRREPNSGKPMGPSPGTG